MGWLVFLLLQAVVAQGGQGSNACVICHETLSGGLSLPVVEWRRSVHSGNGITCDLCHGGDAGVVLGAVEQLSAADFATKKAAAMDRTKGFVGRPAGRAMFAMCGQCHSDTVANYGASIMGKAYLENRGGPSCVACHQAHDNIIPEVPEVCAGCHKDTTGFARIDPMSVTSATVAQLAAIRIQVAGEKARGERPTLAPRFPAELDSYQVGLVAFGGVVVLFLVGWAVIAILEKGDRR